MVDTWHPLGLYITPCFSCQVSPRPTPEMDIIIFSARSSVLYRKPGEHEYKAGEDGVESVFQNCMELPYEKRVASLENLCGYYVAMFDTKCYSQVMLGIS